MITIFLKCNIKEAFSSSDPTVPVKYISFPQSHNYISSTERKRDNK